MIDAVSDQVLRSRRRRVVSSPNPSRRRVARWHGRCNPPAVAPIGTTPHHEQRRLPAEEPGIRRYHISGPDQPQAALEPTSWHSPQPYVVVPMVPTVMGTVPARRRGLVDLLLTLMITPVLGSIHRVRVAVHDLGVDIARAVGLEERAGDITGADLGLGDRLREDISVGAEEVSLFRTRSVGPSRGHRPTSRRTALTSNGNLRVARALHACAWVVEVTRGLVSQQFVTVPVTRSRHALIAVGGPSTPFTWLGT